MVIANVLNTILPLYACKEKEQGEGRRENALNYVRLALRIKTVCFQSGKHIACLYIEIIVLMSPKSVQLVKNP